MKKIFAILIFLLFPFVVNAEDIEINYVVPSYNTAETIVSELSNNNYFNTTFTGQDQKSSYKINIQNTTDKDLYIEDIKFDTLGVKGIDYLYDGIAVGDTLKKNEAKEFELHINTNNNFEYGINDNINYNIVYTSNTISGSTSKTKEEITNPQTGLFNYIIIIAPIIFVLVLFYIKMGKKTKFKNISVLFIVLTICTITYNINAETSNKTLKINGIIKTVEKVNKYHKVTIDPKGGIFKKYTLPVELNLYEGSELNLEDLDKDLHKLIGIKINDEVVPVEENEPIVIKITDDITVEPIWEYGPYYRLLIHPNGGLYDGSSRNLKFKLKKGETYTLKQATKEGYDAVVWYESPYKSCLNNNVVTMSNYDVTLDARYYKEYTVTFDALGGTVNPTSKKVKYDYVYEELPIPTKEGYDFTEWTLNGSHIDSKSKVTTNENHTLVAKYDPLKDTKYTVENYLMNLDMKTYTLKETLNLKGTTDEKLKPEVKTYEGFISPEGEEITIRADGKSSVKYYYQRKTIIIRIKTDNCKDNTECIYCTKYKCVDVTPEHVDIEVPFGTDPDTIPKPTKPGYDLDHYEDKDGNPIEDLTEDTDVIPIFKPKSDTKYKVNYYLMNLDMTTYSFKETKEYQGTTDQLTTEEFKTYAGFTHPDRSDKTISSDGKTSIDYYYTRNTYEITYNPNGGSLDNNKKRIIYGDKYGELETPSKTGYSFGGWYSDNTLSTQVTSNSTYSLTADSNLYAKWNPRTDTKYSVEYYLIKEDLEDYELKETKEYQGTTDSTVDAPIKTYDGFKNPSTKQVKIKPDGSSIVQYYYSRNNYHIVLNPKGGTLTSNILSPIYGLKIGSIPEPSRKGYVFSGWYLEETYNTQITADTKYNYASDIELYAKWVEAEGTIYKVVHYQQNVDGEAFVHDNNNYTVIKTDVLSGRTNQEVTPNTYTYEGFDSPAKQKITINAEGDSVLNYYYTRKSYTVNIENDYAVTSVTGNGTYLYEQPVRIGYTIKDGYSYNFIDGDVNTLTFNMPSHNVIGMVHAKANEYRLDYSTNHGTLSFDHKTVTYDELYGEFPNISVVGYNLSGWYLDSNFINFVDENIYVTTASDHTAYAKMLPKTMELSFDANEGNDVNEIKTITYDSTYGTLPTPTRYGYTFQGWYTDKTDGTKVESTTTVKVVNNQVLYAHWKLNPMRTVTLENAKFEDGSRVKEVRAETYVEIFAVVPTEYTTSDYKGNQSCSSSSDNGNTYYKEHYEYSVGSWNVENSTRTKIDYLVPNENVTVKANIKETVTQVDSHTCNVVSASYSSSYYTCPSDASRSGSTCSRTTTSTYTASQSTGSYSCPNGGSLSGSTCTVYSTSYATPNRKENKNCTDCAATACASYCAPDTCCGWYCSDCRAWSTSYSYSCPSGYSSSGSGSSMTCSKTTSSSYTATYTAGSYYCNSGDSISGTTCTHTSTETFSATYHSGYYYCNRGSLVDGSYCIYLV